MSAANKIEQWVQKKPVILIRLDVEFSVSLQVSRQGFERLTIVKPHSVLQDFKLPTLCLIEVQEGETSSCYLATATSKCAVSTFDSRLTIKKLRPLTTLSFTEIGSNISDTRMKSNFFDHMPLVGNFVKLTPKLSQRIIQNLAANAKNVAAIETALTQLPKLRGKKPNVNWAQADAIRTAMGAFGVRDNAIPTELTIKNDAASELSMMGTYLYEDNVVHADTSKFPGFDAIAPDITGRAVFQKGDERLIIYTANKLPLEKMFGVDLIYINETRGNVVMVQYKMLEESNGDWQFRPNDQLREEIHRMKIPSIQMQLTDYRLSRNPFFFKFIKRKIIDDSHKSFLVSLDHLNYLLSSPDSLGKRNGVRISYNDLNGTYLREADLSGLIRSGYIGTHAVESKALTPIIDQVAKGNKAIVLAWQKKIIEMQ